MNKPVKVLLVEDSEDDAKLALRALRQGGFDPAYKRVQTAAELEVELAQENWDAIISDFNMPGFTGMDALEIFRSSGLDVPFLLVTGAIGEETAVKAMKAGASDYLMKANLARLAPALERELKETQLRAAHRRAQCDLIDSQQRLDGIVTSAMDAIITVDEKMLVVLANTAAENMFGYSAEELQGQPLDRLIPERFRATHPAHIAAFGAAGVTGRRLGALSQISGVRKNGKEFPIEASISKNNSSGRQFFTAILRDITERREAEANILRLNRIYAVLSGINTLIVRVTDRTELFEEACRIATVDGGFRMAMIAIVNPATKTIVPVATAGKDEELITFIQGILASGVEAPKTMVARALREKKAVVSNNSPGDPRVVFGKKYVESGVRSMAVLPLMMFGEAVGVLALYSSEIDFFHDQEMKLLTELTDDIAFAMDHISKTEKIVRLSRIQAVMSGINFAIVHIHNRLSLFNEVCRIALADGRFPFAWLGLLDQATQDVTPVAWAGENPEDLISAKSSALSDSPRGQGAVGMAIRERRPVFNNDIAAHSFGGPREQIILKRGFFSQATLPLCQDRTVVGTLTMYARERDYFDEDEISLLTQIAENISFALENISRQQSLDKLARIRAIASEINAATIRIHDREALLREFCRIAREVGKFELVWIGAVDHVAKQVQPIAWTGFPEESVRAVSWASIGNTKGSLGEAMQTRSTSIRNDIRGELPGGMLRGEALQKGCQSSVCLPLVVGDSVTALVILFAPGLGFFDTEEIALLNEVAGNISFALENISKQERINYLAYYDVLTGLANHSLFIERVAQSILNAVSGGHKLALYLIDLERFRNINESLGQPAGDELLKQVARWMTQNKESASLVARVGADHFAALLPQVRQEGEVVRLLEARVTAFQEHPFNLNGTIFRIAAKVGVALFPDDGADAKTLYRNAEAALKSAKASGERYLFYNQRMNERVAEKLKLENQLRAALDNGEFVLHYQPKINLKSGKLTGAEALIRWNDPRTGLVPPGRFIPILEETGLIYDVGRWALRKALEDYLRWRAAGLPAVRIAVNVSPLQLRNRGFVDEIRQVIDIDPHAAAGLELEITESLIMEDVRHSIASLQAIRDLGVFIAIDDFGTGFSSLSYLAKLPVDTLKIDRSFVTEMTVGPEGLALVSTVINLAHSLRLNVVAEGVETEEQSRLLRLLNCNEMQGYLFSKPVPAEIFEEKFLASTVTA